jgi:aspartyl protease family protein
MVRYLVFAVSMLGFALVAPELFEKAMQNRDTAQQQPQAKNPTAAQSPTQPSPSGSLSGRTASARVSSDGHYRFHSRMNGRMVDVLVDTGAGGVAINASTARRLGIQLSPQDFRYRANTANGVTLYASAIIEEIEIGRVVVRDVRAAVLKDSSLSDTLLGMSFLNKLRSYKVDRGTLILVQ